MHANTILGFLLGALLVSSFASSVAQAGGCQKVAKPALTLAEAEAIALDRVRNGVVLKSKRECEHGRDVYEIDVRDDEGWVHEIAIAVDDGSIVEEEIDD